MTGKYTLKGMLLMAQNIIRVENVSKAFGGVQALDEVNLEIKAGEIHCLVGENGSGKSTMIKIISGVFTADDGTIEINGKKHNRISPKDAINEGIQVIYQDLSVFPNLTVAENISLNNEISEKRKAINWKRIKSIAKNALDNVGVQIDLDELVEDLSVANKQLVAIARSLLNNAKLIIMDEPTTALTKKEVKTLFKIIKDLQSRGISILFVSHKLDEVFEIAERFTIIRNGKNVVTGIASELTHEKFVYYMTGRELNETFYSIKETKTREPLLEVKSISLQEHFDDISFKLFPGEILGITGLLGSGRTELALSLFGVLEINSGDIYIDNKKINLNSIKKAINSGIGYIPEDRLTEGLFLNQSILRNFGISNMDKYKKSLSRTDIKKMENDYSEWKNKIGIVAGDIRNPVKTLSGGNQQKIVLSRWLTTTPKILILNGPTVGVDIAAKFDIHEILRSLAEEGIGIILISDDIPEVLHNCNRILVMKDGRITNELENIATNEQDLTNLMISGK